MKKIELYMIIMLLFILNTGCSAKKQQIVIEFANTLYTTDLTAKGTKQLSNNKNGDIFYQVSRTEPIWYKGYSYFQSNGDFYRSDGSAKGTKEYKDLDINVFTPVIYKNRYCYHKRGNSVYCLDIDNNMKKSKLLELDKSKHISHIASGVYGNRLIILTDANELWISEKEGKSPSLLVSKVDQDDISKILVTKDKVYFVSDNSSDIEFFYNRDKKPKKTLTSYINLSRMKKTKRFSVKDNIITNGEYLFFIKPNGSIHKVTKENISLSSTNSMLIDDFHRFIGIVDNHILYSTLHKEKMGCDRFKHYYELSKVNIKTGQMEDIAKKEQEVSTVGGCYHPEPPMPIPQPKYIIKD